MKFEVLSSDLMSHLTAISRVLLSKNPMPILDNFRFEIGEERLTVTASDGSTTMITSIPIQAVEGNGAFVVPAKTIMDPLKEMPQQQLSIEVDNGNYEVIVSYANGKYNFIGGNADEYPRVKALEENYRSFDINAQALLNGIQSTLFATAEDELRPVMNGIYFDIKADRIIFVASDSKKLVRLINETTEPGFESNFILPKKPASLLKVLDFVELYLGTHDAVSAATPGYGCLAETLFKMAVGNRIGFGLTDGFDAGQLFSPAYGSFVLEVSDCTYMPRDVEGFEVVDLGGTSAEYAMWAAGEKIDLAELQETWESALEGVFAYRGAGKAVDAVSFDVAEKGVTRPAPAIRLARPRVIIPVFPGNNCEYDSAAAFERAGAEAHTFVVNNLTPAAVAESTQAFVEEVAKSQIIMIPGGFSGGDEPDGSAKFITAFFRAPAVTEAVRDLLQQRDGLMLGICNGFQALVKLGLVPFGDIREMDEKCPTLTFNTIGRHQSRLVRTRVASNLSPWLSKTSVGDVHTIAISHGEGRFVAPKALLRKMADAGQIATQYVDEKGVPSMDLDVNPNGSVLAIESITSPDGRVLGKMGHTERAGAGLYKNVPGNTYQELFEGGVSYFA